MEFTFIQVVPLDQKNHGFGQKEQDFGVLGPLFCAEVDSSVDVFHSKSIILGVDSGKGDLVMGIWKGVAMDSLKSNLCSPYPTFLYPAGAPPLKRPYSHFRVGPRTGWAGCHRIVPLWIPNAISLWFSVW
jgi:hypothetical protein